MPNPTRATTAGRIYNDLRNLAQRSRRSTDELMVEYVLERFLYRLAVSPLGGRHFILKGGLLLAQLGARRMTRDIDILGRAFPCDEEEIIHRDRGDRHRAGRGRSDLRPRHVEGHAYP
ncbi:nucleotidyl transferase AbiEii/AbiGii toxin family protein [Nonomuraea angiospora]